MSVAKLKKVIWTIFKYATLLLAIFIAVLPLVSCVITAFKTPEEYAMKRGFCIHRSQKQPFKKRNVF